MPAASHKHVLTGALLASTVLLAGILLFVTQKSTTVKLGERTFAVQVADTPEKRQQGLSGTESLGPDKGMLFVFDDDGYHSIWMKDMIYPIDIVWLDSSKVVVHVAENISPDTYPESFRPAVPSRYVLELSAGTASGNSIAPGVQADF